MGSGNLLSTVLGIIFFPITLLGSWVVVHPQEEVVVLFWGKLRRVIREPGVYWVNVFGRKVHRVTRRQQTHELQKGVVADGNGNPIIVSGIVTYTFVDSIKVALEVEDAQEFVWSQAQAVLKQVCSRYPYESEEGHSLKSEAAEVGRELQEALQHKVSAAGTKVHAFELSDLTYAPEIAQSMLIRQQAKALVDARKIIVEGAVEIVREAVSRLEEAGHSLKKDAREKLVANLLTVICAESKVQPTMPVGSSDGREELTPVLEKMVAKIEKLVPPGRK